MLFGQNSTHVAVTMYGSSLHKVIGPPAGMKFHNAFYRTDGVDKKVLLRIREDKIKLKQRMCTMGHPFGTIKWYDGAHYLLCKEKEKALAEIELSSLAYNLKRAIKMMGMSAVHDWIPIGTKAARPRN